MLNASTPSEIWLDTTSSKRQKPRKITADRAKRFGSSLMITGVVDSSKEDKFVSGSYKLVEGEHLTNDDKDKILMHKDLAAKHGWKVGDKVKLDSISTMQTMKKEPRKQLKLQSRDSLMVTISQQ